MKKIQYLFFLLKKWAVLLVVAVIIGILVTNIVEPLYLQDEIEWATGISSGYFTKNMDLEELSGISSNMTDDERKQMMYKAVFNLCVFHYNPEIIRKNTGESILPQEDMVVMGSDYLRTFYSCPLSYFDEFEWKNTDWGFSLTSYYYKEDKFLPGILETEWPMILPKKFVNYNLTPEDTDGYEYVECNDSYPIIQFYEAPHYSQDIIDENFSEDMEVVYPNGNQRVYYEKASGFMKYKCYEYTDRTIGEEEFTLIFVYDLDLWRYYKDVFTQIYVGLFVGSFIIAAFSAIFDYKRQERIEYQKKLTSSLAHDLKSPLTVISGYVENLDANLFPEKRDVYIKGIEENVNYMNDIIINILEMSRMNGKKNKLQKELINMNLFCSEILEKYRTKITEKGLETKINGEADFECNKVSMERAMDNLINNAITYSSENGAVTIDISKKGIEISNSYKNKINVKPKKLLEPFVKGDDSRGNSGTGLGLYIAKEILNMNGFSVKVEIMETEENFKVKLIK